MIKAITFVESGNAKNGYYFYKSSHDSDYGKIFGMKELTLPKAVLKMKEKGINPENQFKMNICVYYTSNA